MRTRIVLLALLIVSATFSLTAQQPTPPAARVPLAEPAISPDASTIVFASGGDLWTVPAVGGEAHLLVSDPATESRPHWALATGPRQPRNMARTVRARMAGRGWTRPSHLRVAN